MMLRAVQDNSQPDIGPYILGRWRCTMFTYLEMLPYQGLDRKPLSPKLGIVLTVRTLVRQLYANGLSLLAIMRSIVSETNCLLTDAVYSTLIEAGTGLGMKCECALFML